MVDRGTGSYRASRRQTKARWVAERGRKPMAKATGNEVVEKEKTERPVAVAITRKRRRNLRLFFL